MEANIKNLIKELSSYSYLNKEELFSLRVEERLDKSLKEYYTHLNKTLEKLCDYDETHSSLTIIKNLNK